MNPPLLIRSIMTVQKRKQKLTGDSRVNRSFFSRDPIASTHAAGKKICQKTITKYPSFKEKEIIE